MIVTSSRGLEVWWKAKDLVIDVCRVTERFPRREWYGLAAQMQRAALSILSHRTEGRERNRTGEHLQFLGVARSSGSELEAQTEVSRELRYLAEGDDSRLMGKIAEVQRLLRGLECSLREGVRTRAVQARAS